VGLAENGEVLCTTMIVTFPEDRLWVRSTQEHWGKDASEEANIGPCLGRPEKEGFGGHVKGVTKR